jgi:hypothetical protein
VPWFVLWGIRPKGRDGHGAKPTDMGSVKMLQSEAMNGGVSEFTSGSYRPKLKANLGKEVAMVGLEVVIILLFVRIILPIGLIMLVGEWVHRREAEYWLNK